MEGGTYIPISLVQSSIIPVILTYFFNITPFTHKIVSVLARYYTATLIMKYIVTAVSCLKDCHMEKALV